MDLTAAFDVALGRLDRHRYRTDPVGWARDRLGVHLWSRQADVAHSVVTNRRTAVRSGHGVGKSLMASILSLWWCDVHPAGEAMVVTSAPSHEQVHAVLWEYIRRFHAGSDLPGTVQRSDRWLDEQGRLIGIGRRPPDHSDSAFQGIHRRYVLAILDEAGGIPAWLWTAVEAITTGADCRVLAIGNPDNNASEFARVFGQPGWAGHKISVLDSPNFTGEPVPNEMRHGLTSRAWVDDARARWGERSALYQAKVLGEFADAEDGLVPLSWVTAAHGRWHTWRDAGSHQPGGRRVIACDPARYGADQTAIAIREADIIREIRRYPMTDTVQTTDLVDAELAFPRSTSVVDVIGLGAGVVDLLRHRGRPVTAFNASEGTRRRDVTGKWRYPNVRSASLHGVRELLDPSAGATLALPPDDQLTADLTAPTYTEASGGKLVVESKDEIRKRIGRSTDSGDAVAMALWVNPSTARDTDDDTPSRPRAHAYAGSPGFTPPAGGITWDF